MPKEVINPAPGFSGLPLSAPQMEAYSSTIRSLIPPQIMSQAEQIVASHRPEGLIPGEEPVCMAGLKPQEHGDLNLPSVVYPGGEDARERRMAELRAAYADDPVALQQIDVYDGSTEYHVKLEEFKKALMSGNTAKEAELDAWFKEHYPNI